VSESKDLVLLKIDAAKAYLEKARTIQETKQVIALADAARIYGKRIHASVETMNYAAEIRLRAERRLGKILKVTPKATGGDAQRTRFQKRTESKSPPTLAESGVSKKLASRAQQLAKVSTERFEAAIKSKDEINPNRVIKELREETQREARQEKRLEAAASAPETDERIIVGDFRFHADKVANGSLSLIFTDPPYDREASKMLLPLADFAADKLAEGGSLICYVGQTQLPAALDALRTRLRYWWTIACVHSGRSTVMREYGINAGWKAVLWFVKGTRDNNSIMVNDVMSGGQEKEHHDWQQAESEAAYWIDKLCPKNGLCCDPFLGGGTTAAAAEKLGRKWIGFEIDESTAKIASRRVK